MLQDSNQVLAFLVSGWTFAWPTALLAIIWIAWLASWVAASFWSARTQKQVLTAEASTYRIPIFAGGILFTPWLAQAFGIQPLWRFGTPGILVFAVLTLAGISFTWWARIHLGRFWSNTITRKEDHRFLTGNGQYTDDIVLPRQTYAAFVRSPHAHATINGIDTTAAATQA